MNKKEQLKQLICKLYRQDEPEDYTDECMEDMLDNIDFEVLLQAVAHSAKTVYAYEACGVQDCSFNYRSAPLFPGHLLVFFAAGQGCDSGVRLLHLGGIGGSEGGLCLSLCLVRPLGCPRSRGQNGRQHQCQCADRAQKSMALFLHI